MAAPPPSATTSTTSNRVIQKRWVCDICHVKWFLDFEEACRHEKICGGAAAASDVDDTSILATVDSAIAPNTAEVKSEGAKRKGFPVSKDEKTVTAAHAAEQKHPTQAAEIIDIVDTESDTSPYKQTNVVDNQKESPRRSKRVRSKPPPDPPTYHLPTDKTKRAKSSISKFSDKKKREGEDRGKVASFFRPKQMKKDREATEVNVTKDEYEQHLLAERQLKKKRNEDKKSKTSDSSDEEFEIVEPIKAKSKATKSNATKSTKPKVSQNFLAEHCAASFFAKRKRAQEQERERQKKRDEARRLASEKKSKVDEMNVEGKSDEGKRPGAVRFPRPNHVLQGEVEEIVTIMDEVKLTPRYPHGSVDLTAPDEEVMTGLSFFGEDWQPEADVVPQLFASAFEPTKHKIKKNGAKLWTDKYTIKTIPSSILGTQNQQSASKLIQFIEDWKVRRHKSTLTKKSKKRKSGYDSDDSFLDGDSGRTSLFLITGPTGSGKSRLVHAISSSLDCVVMEINSSEARGGGVLKKKVLESTLSHSSVALMKKREGGMQMIVEGKKKEFFDEESSDEEVEEKSSLTVVLIDEADLLFQDHGDTGFWLSISQLTQKAKSPIVLTASSVPPELLSGTMNYEHIELQRPSIEECCEKMNEVAKSEGMGVREDANDEVGNNKLALIAEYFQCDIRRILNEMQLYHSAIESQSCTTDVAIFRHNQKAKDLDSATKTGVEDDRPVILNVDPVLVPKDRHTLITIEGKNFQRTELASLYLGGTICRHFAVVNDSKIVAVCPPMIVPDGVTSGLRYKKASKGHPVDCLTSKFVPIVVSKRCSNGLVLNSSTCLPPHRADWNLEYNISLERSMLDEKHSTAESVRRAKAQRKRLRLENAADDGFLSSEEEYEFGADASQQPMSKTIIDESSSEEETDQNAAVTATEIIEENTTPIVQDDVDPQELLNAALSEIVAEKTEDVLSKPTYMNFSLSVEELSTCAEEIYRLSDVASLEYGLLSIPMLTGAVEGFGSQVFDDIFGDSAPVDPSIDKLCKEKKQLPSFESLYLSGTNENGFFFGNADAFMMHPCRQRERRLLLNSQLYSRGFGFLDNFIEHELPENESSNDAKELDPTEHDNLQSRTQSEDDVLLCSASPPALLLLHCLRGEQSGSTDAFCRSTIQDGPWFQIRKQEMSNKALSILSTLLVPESSYYEHDWNKVCFGLRQSRHFMSEMAEKSRLCTSSTLMDASLALDYLPHLRFLAYHENKVHLASERLTTNISDDNTRRSRTSKRLKSSHREHYLQELGAKYGSRQYLHDKLTELGSSYLLGS